MSAAAAFSSASAAVSARRALMNASSRPVANNNGRGAAARLAVRAIGGLFGKKEEDVELARDTIDLSKRKIGLGSGKPVTVTFLGADDQKIEVQCPEDQYILDAALEAGLEIPFTCRGGICGACVARCVEGPSGVDQSDITDIDFTLDEDEQAQGMVLLCMARPVGDISIETQSDWGYSLGVCEWKGATGEIAGRDPTPLMGKSDRKGL